MLAYKSLLYSAYEVAFSMLFGTSFIYKNEDSPSLHPLTTIGPTKLSFRMHGSKDHKVNNYGSETLNVELLLFLFSLTVISL